MEAGSLPNTPYRDDKPALAARLERLRDELAAIRETRSEIEALASREQEIHAEIAQLTAELSKARAKGQLPLLKMAYVASPCKADWNEMVGDERTRFCGKCNKNVHNLSEMSFDEAEAFLQQLTTDACVRLYRRKDGTVMTNDCPVGVRNKRIKRAAGLLVGTGLAAAGIATKPSESGPVMGEMAVPLHMGVLQAELTTNQPHSDERIPVMGGLGPIEPPPEKIDQKPQFMMGPTKPANPHKIKGTIVANCTITKEGRTRDCKVVSGPSSMRQPMLDMLAAQVYMPGRKNGIGIESKAFTVKVDLDPPPNQTGPTVETIGAPRPLPFYPKYW